MDPSPIDRDGVRKTTSSVPYGTELLHPHDRCRRWVEDRLRRVSLLHVQKREAARGAVGGWPFTYSRSDRSGKDAIRRGMLTAATDWQAAAESAGFAAATCGCVGIRSVSAIVSTHAFVLLERDPAELFGRHRGKYPGSGR